MATIKISTIKIMIIDMLHTIGWFWGTLAIIFILSTWGELEKGTIKYCFNYLLTVVIILSIPFILKTMHFHIDFDANKTIHIMTENTKNFIQWCKEIAHYRIQQGQ